MRIKFLVTVLFLITGIVAGRSAVSPVAGAGPDSSAGLKTAVAALSEKKKKPATDYARMAEETIQFGGHPDAVQKLSASSRQGEDPKAPWRGMVGDALAGVDEGERMDAKAADWPRLRDELKKLQPPPPQKSDSSKSSKDQKQDKKQSQDKKSGKGKNEPQDQKGGQGEKTDNSQGGSGQEEKDSQSPPSSDQKGQGGQQGKPGEKNQGEGSEQDGTSGDEKQKQEAKGKGKDPNQVKDYSSSKEQEGTMRDRENEVAPIQDQGAGFAGMGQDKKDQGKEQGKLSGGMAEGGEKKEKGKEAPEGMRMVGGGSGKKEKDGKENAFTLEANSRLEQVRQSDSPAILQQRLQPKDQRPSPSSTAKPW
jgi:Ca-activated chloride channel family protein